jgi:hypothetical protein
VSTPPPELPGGQESELPDLRLALVVAVALLTDIEPTLREREPELFLRLVAVRSVLRRLRAHIEEAS